MRTILSHYNSLVLLYKKQEILIQLYKKFRVTATFKQTRDSNRRPTAIHHLRTLRWQQNRPPPHFNTSRLHYVAITDSTNYCCIKISVFMKTGQRVQGRRGAKWTRLHTAKQHSGLTSVYFIYQQIRSKNI